VSDSQTLQNEGRRSLLRVQRKESGIATGRSTLAVLPFLYNIYISDTPRAAGWNLALYADDTALLDFDYDRSGKRRATERCR